MAAQVLSQSKEDWRCGGTWFVGVDALPNDADGAMAGVAFPWQALPLAPEPLHRAQLSVIRPGYPQTSPAETPAAFRFRRDRDAAHLDGVLALGPDKRRSVKEPHRWILGVPLNCASADASPLVVWEGSHEILRDALLAALQAHAPDSWGDVDLTDAYRAARALVFARCLRVPLPVAPGEATLLHRLTLHGVAPWGAEASAPAAGRMIAYLRPQMPSVQDWLQLP